MIFESWYALEVFQFHSLKHLSQNDYLLHSWWCQFLTKLLSGFQMVYCTQADSLYLPIWEKLQFAFRGEGLSASGGKPPIWPFLYLCVLFFQIKKKTLVWGTLLTIATKLWNNSLILEHKHCEKDRKVTVYNISLLRIKTVLIISFLPQP